MTLRSRLKGAALGALVGAPGQRVREAAAEMSRRVRRQPRAVDFFHDPTDPGSYLIAQAVARLAARYPVEWRFRAVSPPASDVDPQPRLRLAHAIRDAHDVVQFWDLDFPAAANRELDPTTARRIGAVLIRERPFDEQLRAALALGDAAWRGDHAALQKHVGAWGHEAHVAVAPGLAAGYDALRSAGHYLGGSLHYGGDWYVGVDRVRYLEERLAEDSGVAPGPGVLAARPASARPPQALLKAPGPVPVDFWFSFRSPFSYLAIDRVAALPGIELRIRPILPMADRGMKPPIDKRLALVRDAKREADRLGIPFGRIADPLGKGVEHCLAIARRAIERGKGVDFLRSAARGIWAEAMDVASYVDLRAIVERAGLDWDDARAALAEPDAAWRDWVKGNADDLAAIGLWGVPSFRAGDYVTWGQDRIEHLADRLRRHAEAAAA